MGYSTTLIYEAESAISTHRLALDSDEYQFLCFKPAQAAIKAREVILKHWQPKGIYNQNKDIEDALSELGVLNPPTLSPPPHPPVHQMPPSAASWSPPPPPEARQEVSIPFARVVSNFWDDKSGGWKPRTKTGYLQCKAHILEHIGPSTPIHTINYDVMKAYRQLLQDSGLSISRVNFYTTFAAGIFNHEMKTTGYLKLNPAGGLKLKDTRRRDEMRDGFTLEDLKAMFVKAPAYWDDTHTSAERFWIPLLALFSGMRLEEICQLHVDQVQQVDEIGSLIVEETHKGQSVKTSERREIPLHPFLIDGTGSNPGLGFHRYVQGLPKGGRLWPNLKRANDRYGHYFGRWFGRFWRDTGITGKLGFHSFRHCVETELREADVEGLWIDMLTGHSIAGEGGGRYTKRSTKTILEKAVMKLRWNGKLDLTHLLKSKWALPKEANN